MPMNEPSAPSVSVIVPAYNVGRFIEQCLRSALAQSLRDIEVIAVNDGSRDNTGAILAHWAERNPRLQLISKADNAGVADARNEGLTAARGRWIALLDADDWIAPERLSRLVAAGEALGADWIADDLYIVRESEEAPCARILAREPQGARLIDGAHLVLRDVPEHLGYSLLKPMIRRAFLERHALRYRRGLRHSEDFLFTIDCVAAGAKLALLNEARYFYRLRAGQITALDPLSTLAVMRETNALARTAAREASNGALDFALARRARLIERACRYYRAATPWKEGHRGAALRMLLKDPGIWPLVLRKLAIRIAYALTGRDRIGLVLLEGAPRGPSLLREARLEPGS
jgi:glycosyltransferase involved in cell wall biosynthesis